ncbi:MAG: TonB-dependent receptor [Nitrospirae bacterium]|nr:TonB-dependent receptor [Nitrospirota bacterium]
MKRIIILILIMFFTTVPLMASEPETIKVDEVVVTATRYEEKLSSVPLNTSVITEEEIKNSTAQNIPDLLRAEPGIQVNDIGGNRRNITVDIRGFGETSALNTLVLVDGRRVNQADLSGTDWTQIPVDRVKKIEIIRGGRAAVLYGDNAAGGVINIITKEGAALNAGVGAVAGSYDTYKGNAYLSNSMDKLSYSVNGSYLSSDGYRDNSDTEAKDLGANLNFYPYDFIKLNLSTGYHKDKTGLPGALKESDFAAGASRTDTTNPYDFAEIEDYYFKGGPEIYFWKDSNIKLDVSFRERDVSTFSSFAVGEFSSDTEIKTFALSPQILLKNEIGHAGNSLVAGFDYQHAEEDITNDSLFFGSRTIGDFKLQKKNRGYYLHDEISISDDLLLSAGYRHDNADFTFDPGIPDSATIDENLYTAGINYNFYKKSYIYLNYAKSFRYPVLDELFSFFTSTIDTSLTSQRSNDYEIGLRHYFTNDIYAHVNFFRIDTDDEIFFNPVSYANENMDGKTRRDGVEISFDAKPLKWLELNGSYTYMSATIEGGQFKGNDIPNVPNHKTALSAVIDMGRGFTAALNGIYVGERPFISDFAGNFEEQENYLVMNGKLKYKWHNLTAFLDINNITDSEYSEYGVLGGYPLEKAFYPSPKRNFLAGVTVDF